MTKSGKAEKSAARGERLKAALRENLKKRKHQARARGGAPDAREPYAAAQRQGSDFRRNQGAS